MVISCICCLLASTVSDVQPLGEGYRGGRSCNKALQPVSGNVADEAADADPTEERRCDPVF